MEVATISVERQEPTKSSTARPASTAAVTISWTTSFTESFTKPDWSPMTVSFTPFGSVRSRPGSLALMPATTDSVDASPDFSTSSSTDWWPATTTVLRWGGPPRCTKATSRRYTTALPTCFTGRSLNASIFSGVALVTTM